MRGSKLVKFASILMIVVLTMSFLLSAGFIRPAHASSDPTVTSVSFTPASGTSWGFQAYTITVEGSGFGALPITLPYSGDTSYFRIADAAQVGFGEWGYSGDAKTLNYETWTDTQMVLGGFGATAGDAVTVALWNPATGVGATWGGNVPPRNLNYSSNHICHVLW